VRPDLNRRAVGKDFGATLGKLGRIETHSDDRVGFDLMRVLDHPARSLAPRVLANMRELFDIATDYRFQSADDSTPDPSRPNNDPANNATVFDDFKTG
jgi:hypothetical protein